MCKFFSCISNGKEVKYFTPEDIAKIMSEGNKKSYEWNSHTSIAHFNKIEGLEEDKWTKWEYDTFKKVLSLDGKDLYNDKEMVTQALVKFFNEKDI